MFQLIITLIKELVDLIALGFRVRKLYVEAQDKKWIEEGKTLSEAIRDAKTDDDRAALAKLLFDHRAK